MAMRIETNPMEAAYAALLPQGLEGAGEALRILVNEASKIERAHPSTPSLSSAAMNGWARPMAISQRPS